MKKIGIAVLLMALSAGASAAIQQLVTGVQQVYATEDERFGGCMVKTVEAVDRNLNCKRGYVTLDCAGALDGNSKSEGQRKMDVATLAFLTGGRVNMLITDEARINGYCHAERVRMLPNAG